MIAMHLSQNKTLSIRIFLKSSKTTRQTIFITPNKKKQILPNVVKLQAYNTIEMKKEYHKYQSMC